MISILKKTILFTISFLFTILLFFGLYLYLYGLNISSFSYKDISVNGLYIKLDKKLIVKINKLKIPNINSNLKNTNSLDDIQKDLEYIPILKQYFTLIDIKDLIIGSQHMIVSYNDENIYFDNNLVNISVKPEFSKNTINLNLYSLYLKDYKMMFDGEIKLDLKKESSFLTGNFYYKELQGTINSIANKKQIEFHIDSSSMKNIRFVKDFIRLHKIIESWMYDNITGKFKLNYLMGIIDITGDKPKLVKLEGDAQVQDASIIYHKNLKPIKTKLLSITYKNDNLYFNMKNPTYRGIKVYGSNVVISSLMGKKPNIVINIKTKNKLTKDIIQIVQAFGGAIPIEQLSGSTNSKLKIKIDLFGKFKTNLYGTFKTKNSTFKIKNFKFKALDATVKLNNDNLKIIKSSLLYDKNLFMKLDLDINLKTKQAAGIATNIKYNIKNDEYVFLNIHNISSKLKVDFSNGLNIDIKQLNLKLVDNLEVFKVYVKDIKKIVPYSPFLKENKLNNGNLILNLNTKNMLTFEANLNNLDLPLMINKKRINNLNLNGIINKSNIKINSKDNRISYTNKPNILHLKNVDILYNTKSKQSNNKFKDIRIYGNKSNILIDNKYKILSDNFEISFQDNILRSFTNQYKVTNMKYINNLKEKTLSINDITPEFFKFLTKKDFIKSGKFDLSAYATKNIYNGEIIIKNVLIEPKTKAKAIIQTNDKKEKTTLDSYFIKHGNIKYKYNIDTKYLDMYEVKTNGNGLDLDGKMNLNFSNDHINGIFNASFFKGASDVIGKIPLVNYIILGDEQNFSVKAKIKGTFDDIKISTNTASSAVKAPISIIGRIITLPVKAIQKIGEEINTKNK